MPKPPSSGGEEEEKPRGEASEDLCEMALDPELLLLRDDGEEEFGMCSVRGKPAGAWCRLPASLAVVLSCVSTLEPVWACVVLAPNLSQAFCSRSQARGF